MDFWQAHGTTLNGIGFLLCAAFVPRLLMLFAVATPFGLLHWLGWLIAPHITLAVMATVMYWDTNPWLVVAAWLVALGRSSSTDQSDKDLKPTITFRSFSQGKSVVIKTKKVIRSLTDHERFSQMSEPPSDWKDVIPDLDNQRPAPDFFDDLRKRDK